MLLKLYIFIRRNIYSQKELDDKNWLLKLIILFYIEKKSIIIVPQDNV